MTERPWQMPLTEDKILWLQEQFALTKHRIEAVWGKPDRPWVRTRNFWER